MHPVRVAVSLARLEHRVSQGGAARGSRLPRFCTVLHAHVPQQRNEKTSIQFMFLILQPQPSLGPPTERETLNNTPLPPPPSCSVRRLFFDPAWFCIIIIKIMHAAWFYNEAS
jgi:hypothetical protein